eukprot:SM000223S07323  [mRNA]  locus=s223:115734:116843:+ [translate_table: standard]
MAAMAAAAAAVLLALSAAMADGAREAASPGGGACLPGFAPGPRSGTCLLAAPGPASFGQAEAESPHPLPSLLSRSSSRLAVVATVGATVDALPRLHPQRRGGRLATLLGRLALEDVAELCRALPGGTGDGGSSECLVGATRGLQPESPDLISATYVNKRASVAFLSADPPWRWTEPCAAFSTGLWLATTTPSAASPSATAPLHTTWRPLAPALWLAPQRNDPSAEDCGGWHAVRPLRWWQQDELQQAAAAAAKAVGRCVHVVPKAVVCASTAPFICSQSACSVTLSFAVSSTSQGLLKVLLGAGHAHSADSDGQRRHLRVESKTSKTKMKTKKTKKKSK